MNGARNLSSVPKTIRLVETYSVSDVSRIWRLLRHRSGSIVGGRERLAGVIENEVFEKLRQHQVYIGDRLCPPEEVEPVTPQTIYNFLARVGSIVGSAEEFKSLKVRESTLRYLDIFVSDERSIFASSRSKVDGSKLVDIQKFEDLFECYAPHRIYDSPLKIYIANHVRVRFKISQANAFSGGRLDISRHSQLITNPPENFLIDPVFCGIVKFDDIGFETTSQAIYVTPNNWMRLVRADSNPQNVYDCQSFGTGNFDLIGQCTAFIENTSFINDKGQHEPTRAKINLPISLTDRSKTEKLAFTLFDNRRADDFVLELNPYMHSIMDAMKTTFSITPKPFSDTHQRVEVLPLNKEEIDILNKYLKFIRW